MEQSRRNQQHIACSEYRFRQVSNHPNEWSGWTLQPVQEGTLRQSATINSLTLGMEYEFELRALSIRGASDPVPTSESLMVVENPMDDPRDDQVDDEADDEADDEMDVSELDLEGLALNAKGKVQKIDLTWNMQGVSSDRCVSAPSPSCGRGGMGARGLS